MTLLFSLRDLCTGVVPTTFFPQSRGYRLGYVRWSICGGHFQHPHSDDPREKPCSDTEST
jgi:hypothetical protein